MIVTQVDAQLFQVSSPQFFGSSLTVNSDTLALTLEKKFQCDQLTDIHAKYTGQDGSTQDFTGRGPAELQRKVKSALQKAYEEAKLKESSTNGVSDSNTADTSKSSPLKFKACLDGDAILLTPHGSITMAELARTKDTLVATVNSKGDLAFAPVDLWLHFEPETVAEFIHFQTATNDTVTLTPEHLIFVSTHCAATSLTPEATLLAHQVAVGDCLWIRNSNGRMVQTVVVSIKTLRKRGIYSPLVSEGNILVNNVLSSCYSGFNSPRLQSVAIRYFVFMKQLASRFLSSGLFDTIFGAEEDGALPISEVISALHDMSIWALR